MGGQHTVTVQAMEETSDPRYAGYHQQQQPQQYQQATYQTQQGYATTAYAQGPSTATYQQNPAARNLNV
jgi:hypothetical protein